MKTVDPYCNYCMSNKHAWLKSKLVNRGDIRMHFCTNNQIIEMWKKSYPSLVEDLQISFLFTAGMFQNLWIYAVRMVVIVFMVKLWAVIARPRHGAWYCHCKKNDYIEHCDALITQLSRINWVLSAWITRYLSSTSECPSNTSNSLRMNGLSPACTRS